MHAAEMLHRSADCGPALLRRAMRFVEIKAI